MTWIGLVSGTWRVPEWEVAEPGQTATPRLSAATLLRASPVRGAPPGSAPDPRGGECGALDRGTVVRPLPRCSASSSLTLTARAGKQPSQFGESALEPFVGEAHTRGAPGPSAEDREERLLQVSRKDASALGGGATPNRLGRASPRLHCRSASPDSGRSRMEAQLRTAPRRERLGGCLSECVGFRVETSQGLLGVVEEIRWQGDRAGDLVVRAGKKGRRLLIPSARGCCGGRSR